MLCSSGTDDAAGTGCGKPKGAECSPAAGCHDLDAAATDVLVDACIVELKRAKAVCQGWETLANHKFVAYTKNMARGMPAAGGT